MKIITVCMHATFTALTASSKHGQIDRSVPTLAEEGHTNLATPCLGQNLFRDYAASTRAAK